MHIVRIGGVSTEQHSADLIGNKAANLARMAALGLPVPPAFVLPVKLCADDHRQGCACRAAFARRAEGGHRVPGKRYRKALRRRPAAAIGIGPLGGGAIDAGHAGHRAQCRLHVARRAGSDPLQRPAAARLGLPAALSGELRRDRARARSRPVRRAPRRVDRQAKTSPATASWTARRSNVSPPTSRR